MSRDDDPDQRAAVTASRVLGHPLFAQVASIAKHSTLLAGLRAGGMLAGLLLAILLARELSPTEFGAVSIAFSLALVLGRLVTLNIDAGAMRFVTRYHSDGDEAGIRSYLAFGSRILLYCSATILAALTLIAAAQLTANASSSYLHLAAGIAAAPLFGWIRMRSMVVSALGHVLLAALPQSLLRPLMMLVITTLAFLVWPQGGVAMVLAIYISTALAICFLIALLFRRVMAVVPAKARAADHKEWQRWLSVGLGLLIPTLFLELSVNIIVLMASLVLAGEQVAVLTVVLRIQAIVLFGITSINMVVAPRIARSHSDGDVATVKNLLLVTAHLKLWPALLIIGLLTVFGRQLLGIFGPEYEVALMPLLIVCMTPVIMSVFGPVVLFVTILGLQRAANRVFQLAIVTLGVLIVITGYYFGVEGVCITVVVVWLGWHLVLYRLIKSNSGYSTLRLFPVRAPQ